MPIVAPEAESVDVTVTVVSWNTRELLGACLRALAAAALTSDVVVHVVDNASSDGSADMVARDHPEVLLLRNADNIGFAAANNVSWPRTRGRYWLLLNSDAEVGAGAIDRLVAFLDARPRAAMATARLVGLDGEPQPCADLAPSVLRTFLITSRLDKLLPAAVGDRQFYGWRGDRAPRAEREAAPVRVDWVWGTALMARREAVSAVGPLDARFFMYGEDMEWCMRAGRAGWEVWLCPDAEVLHHGGASSAGRWADERRTQLVLDGSYRAVESVRGPAYARTLLVADAVATGAEWLLARARRAPGPAPAVMAYSWRSLRRPEWRKEGNVRRDRLAPAAAP